MSSSPPSDPRVSAVLLDVANQAIKPVTTPPTPTTTTQSVIAPYWSGVVIPRIAAGTSAFGADPVDPTVDTWDPIFDDTTGAYPHYLDAFPTAQGEFHSTYLVEYVGDVRHTLVFDATAASTIPCILTFGGTSGTVTAAVQIHVNGVLTGLSSASPTPYQAIFNLLVAQGRNKLTIATAFGLQFLHFDLQNPLLGSLATWVQS